ncbi:hypothetical protein KF707_03145 [Candidatus Obscuribacterales bacterium]|jgi:hypothetical protein|nr:hypothetical protein [Candidatus Obscuribacterales bacterium]MBX3135206.1 hypothetical protein [Candidatus Obscuribacterales bacterium]MBX3148685.1 hypothetical protein [Candidatus Obscuribacterales bacterium]
MSSKGNSKGKIPTELKVMERLTLVEQFIAKLKLDFDASGFRKSRIVENGIASGLAAIDKAVELIADEEFKDADTACKVAWLHAHFARGLFDAETTEHYLGEGVFLELGDLPDSEWRQFAAEELSELQEEIVNLRAEIKEQSNKSA